MRVIRDRAEAKWLPSRFHFALARLVAYVVFRRAAPRDQRGLVLAVDRNQNGIESYAASIGVLILATCYTAVLLGRLVHPIAAAVLAVPMALAALQVPIVLLPLTAALPRIQRHAMRVNSLLLTTVLLCLSLYFAVSDGWVRIIARTFFVLVLMNVLAAIVIWPLRQRFAELEGRYEGAPP